MGLFGGQGDGWAEALQGGVVIEACIQGVAGRGEEVALGESVARLPLVGGKAQPVGHLNRAARLIEMGLQ